MKPLILYHANCMDGAGSALAAWMKFKEEAEYRAVAYGVVIPDIELNNRDVYVLDFSFKLEETRRIASLCRKLVILDHHASARDELKQLTKLGDVIGNSNAWILDQDNIHVEMDMSHSGATLSWKYFHPEKLRYPYLLQYIADRDLWKWELPYSKEISAALAALGAATDFRKLEPYLNDATDIAIDLRHEGTAILRAQDALVAQMARASEGVVLAGHWTHAVNASCLQSEIAHALLNPDPNGPLRAPDVAAVYFWDPSEKGGYRVSLRSKPDGPDVARIAASFSGGGHPNAAGFECTELPWRAPMLPKFECGHVFPNGQSCVRSKGHDVHDSVMP